MNKLHYLCLVLVVIALLLYGSMLVYFEANNSNGTKLIDTINLVLSPSQESDTLVNANKKTYLEAVGLSVTEERSIIGVMLISIAIFISTIVLLLRERKHKGHHTVQIPMIFLSVILIMTCVAQSINFGVF